MDKRVSQETCCQAFCSSLFKQKLGKSLNCIVLSLLTKQRKLTTPRLKRALRKCHLPIRIFFHACTFSNFWTKKETVFFGHLKEDGNRWLNSLLGTTRTESWRQTQYVCQLPQYVEYTQRICYNFLNQKEIRDLSCRRNSLKKIVPSSGNSRIFMFETLQ
jgi:hypothetical protein